MIKWSRSFLCCVQERNGIILFFSRSLRRSLALPLPRAQCTATRDGPDIEAKPASIGEFCFDLRQSLAGNEEEESLPYRPPIVVGVLGTESNLARRLFFK